MTAVRSKIRQCWAADIKYSCLLEIYIGTVWPSNCRYVWQLPGAGGIASCPAGDTAAVGVSLMSQRPVMYGRGLCGSAAHTSTVRVGRHAAPVSWPRSPPRAAGAEGGDHYRGPCTALTGPSVTGRWPLLDLYGPRRATMGAHTAVRGPLSGPTPPSEGHYRGPRRPQRATIGAYTAVRGPRRPHDQGTRASWRPSEINDDDDDGTLSADVSEKYSDRRSISGVRESITSFLMFHWSSGSIRSMKMKLTSQV